jgi:RHS repeat-associated protein
MVAQSLPYAYGGSPVWTAYTYDGSGRTVKSVKPDGSTTTYLYSGNNNTTTDPAGKWKPFTSDAFGDLIIVTEPDPASNTGGTVATNYTYNGASQLTQVSMPRGSITQTRTFTWSGSDMASATNPENGTVSYTYDGNHHVTQRTDAKGQKTNYTYDAYERLTQTQHVLANGNADPVQQVNYYYDSNPYYPSFSTNAVGRLAAVTFANEAGSAAAPLGSSGTEQFIYNYGYNVAGRVTAQQLTVSPASGYPVNLNASYSWDNQGRMTGLNYPNSGPQETLSYDAMSNLSTINENLCTSENSSGACITWAQGQLASAAYSNIGQLTGFGVLTNGFSSGTSYTYNTLQQLTAINYATNIAGVMVQWTYTYAAGQNNGRITQFSDTGFAGTGEIVNYTYDSLNRLVAATTSNSTGPQWGESYAYDEFGNLQSKTPTQGTAPQVSTGVNSANNQVAPSDANGNWLGSNYPQYAWDVENRLVGNSSYDGYGNPVSYTYDPWGKRVMQYASSGGTKGVTTCQIYFYGANGKRLGIYNCGYTSNGYQFVESTATINQYLGKRLIATGPETGPNVVAVDRLGSVRNVGPAWYFPIDYFPYGEERTSTANGTDKFGTYFRDGYGQDYADQRFYASTYGNFTSPDPSMDNVDYKNPLSWNAYSYVNGDPINFNDPTGLATTPTCGSSGFYFNGKYEGTIAQIMAGTSNEAILAGAMYTESGHGAKVDVTDEEYAIGAVIMNRWEFVNKNWYLSSSAGGPSLNVSGWGTPGDSIKSIIENPSQFAIYTNGPNGPVMSASAQNNLNSAIGSSATSSGCEDLAWALTLSYGMWGERNDGNPLYLYNGLILTGFNSFNPAHASAPYEQSAGSFGDANTFYGVPDSYVSETPIVPIRRPRPPRPPRRPQ